ncbi:MAG: hypothetical protein V3U33_01235 [candidate division NC10 bacterium]
MGAPIRVLAYYSLADVTETLADLVFRGIMNDRGVNKKKVGGAVRSWSEEAHDG